eukprot:224472-Hanusia_phi.AAC.1
MAGPPDSSLHLAQAAGPPRDAFIGTRVGGSTADKNGHKCIEHDLWYASKPTSEEGLAERREDGTRHGGRQGSAVAGSLILEDEERR